MENTFGQYYTFHTSSGFVINKSNLTFYWPKSQPLSTMRLAQPHGALAAISFSQVHATLMTYTDGIKYLQCVYFYIFIYNSFRFGNQPLATNCALMSVWSPALSRNWICLVDTWMILFYTAGVVGLRVKWHSTGRSASSLWKVLAAGIL